MTENRRPDSDRIAPPGGGNRRRADRAARRNASFTTGPSRGNPPTLDFFPGKVIAVRLEGSRMTVVVVGNPKPMSRTRAAAELVAERLTGAPPEHVVDVVDLGAGLLGWGDPEVARA